MARPSPELLRTSPAENGWNSRGRSSAGTPGSLASPHGAVIQVAEALQLRRRLTRRILVDFLWQQAALAALIALVVVVVVQRPTRPVRRLREELQSRSEGDQQQFHPGDHTSGEDPVLSLVSPTAE